MSILTDSWSAVYKFTKQGSKGAGCEKPKDMRGSWGFYIPLKKLYWQILGCKLLLSINFTGGPQANFL